MGWGSEEEVQKKKMETSSKILIGIIACVILIIILISVLLMNINSETFIISVDGKATAVTKEQLFTSIDNKTYINIQELSKLVGYEYHEGEYKAYITEKNKCYAKGINETATFYENENKIYKLPINALTSDYQIYNTENPIKKVGDVMYGTKDAMQTAFNIVLDEKSNSFDIYTLDYLVGVYDKKVKEWGYTGVSEQSFENQKTLLYGYIIVKKENGLYKIINNENTKEVIPDKYSNIEFIENTGEFFVTNSLGQVGIINLDGTTKIEPIYESIAVLDKTEGLYLIQKDKKYGVIKSGNITVINPEYDSIGLNSKSATTNTENQYLIGDNLIPVIKDGKYGAFSKDGKLVIKTEYDGFGSNLTTVEVEGTKKVVEPVLIITKCNGIVVKKAEKYGLIDFEGKELVPMATESIYGVANEKDENSKYFMLYNGKEMNIIERLIEVGLIQDESKEESSNTNTIANNTILTNNISNSSVINNSITNTIQ